MAKKKGEETEDIVFNWDEPTDPNSFFTEPTPAPAGDEEDPKPKGKAKDDEEEDEDPPGGPEGDDEEEDDGDDFDFGGDPDEEEEDEEEDEEDKKPKKKPGPKPKPKPKAPEGNEGDDEDEPDLAPLADFAERMGLDPENIEDSFDDIVEEKLRETLEGFPEDVREAMIYVKNGGNIRDFYREDKPSVINITKNLDMEEEANQLAVIIQDRIDKGDDEETAKEYAEFLKESDKLKQKAGLVFNKVVEAKEKAEKKRVEDQKAAKREAERKAIAYRDNLARTMKKVKDVKFNTNERINLVPYMTKPTEDIGAGRLVPKLHKDLQKILAEDPEKALVLAKFVMSGVDLESVKASVVTTKTKNVIAKTRAKKKTAPKRRDPLEDFLGPRK